MTIHRGFTSAPGSVLVKAGQTHVLCTATIQEDVPEWRKESGLGWVTAEYDMLPASTGERRKRDRSGKIDGRTQEIQRLIGRSLRAVVDMKKLGPRTVWVDCDVLQADGGTRTASITGSYVALADALASLRRRGILQGSPLVDQVAAVSVGKVGGRCLLDLSYEEDRGADVDFNVVQTSRGHFVEVQGAAEGGTFSRSEMMKMIRLAERGVAQLHAIQRRSLARRSRS